MIKKASNSSYNKIDNTLLSIEDEIKGVPYKVGGSIGYDLREIGPSRPL
jgi:hypothetical protein